jgi:hypothetical protein
MSCSRDVRFPPESDRIADVPDWLLRAKSRHYCDASYLASRAVLRQAARTARIDLNAADSRTHGPRPLTLVRNSTAILPGRPLSA